MAKLKNAPYLKQQDATGESPVTICLGSQAWRIAEHFNELGKSADEIALENALGETAGKFPCVVADSEILEQVEEYRLAPKNAQSIRLIQANNGQSFPADTMERIYLHLAKTTTAENVIYCNEAGELLENVSQYIQRLRKGETYHGEIQLICESTRDNHQPYTEKRKENGIAGLFRVIPKLDKDTGEMVDKCEWLADCVDVVGVGISESDYFSMLSFQAQGKTEPTLIALPWAEIGERAGWQLLKQKGVRLTNSQRLKPHLADYLQDTQDKPIYQIVNETGWQADFNAYILPNGEVLGKPNQPVYFNNKSATTAGYQSKGTLSDWQREIGQYIEGNHSMMLGVACALAAPLIGLIGAESFGVHLFGKSSAGKTTIANIASSIYGEPDLIRLSWNGTSLGLINEAAARNDGFIPLDEIGQGASKKHVEQTAYALFNGVGKIQGAKEGGNRELNRWRILAFSTGEQDLELYLKQDNIRTNAGQLVRLLNIPITPASTFYHFGNGKAHADHLNAMTRQYYGTMGKAWIMWLLENKQAVVAEYQRYAAQWQAMLPSDASPQVKRVAGRFALLETALQLASPFTGWKTIENQTALLHSFNEWVNEYGLHSREEKQIIEQVNGWLLRYGSRFIEIPLNPNQKEPNDTAGYRLLVNERNDKEKFFIYPQVYLGDVIKGFNEKQANEILFNAGMLERSNETPPRFRVRVPASVDKKQTRCYVLIPISEPEEEKE
ncbi:DUF927 domain-containing protein [Rodentibacter caecimuris]|uniref:DUF927 domain-containing protein n=1 Tax=Rodentibacter caecimuris TaxID=1796644 RepID=UPI0013A0A3CD|nr:DUF927 domain-containing protein [Rodentibacter heylii]QIA77691.1 DUF927 domain-containing protein [Rodentibacter heylii]